MTPVGWLLMSFTACGGSWSEAVGEKLFFFWVQMLLKEETYYGLERLM